MKKFILLIAIVFGGLLIQAQDQNTMTYNQDTIWLKAGLVMPCTIIEDSSNSEYIYVNYVSSAGQISRSRFAWSQVKTAHKQSYPFVWKYGEQRVELKNGIILIGTVLSETETQMELQIVDLGILTIEKEKIKSIVPLGQTKKTPKAYWFKNPHATRLLFAPTAIPLKKGEGYYQNIYIVANMFNYGVANNFSIGGGFDFITLFSEDMAPLLNVNIKSGFQVSENLHLGVGGLYVGMIDEFSAGIIYGLGTYGSYNTNATLGLGWGFVDGTFQEKPFIMIGGMARVSEKLWLVSENWIVPTPEYYLVVSYGLRFAAKRIAVDLAFINSKDIYQELFIGIPFVDFVIKLGK